jgi:peptidyl-tRNA hydrolase, PTH1 family
VTWGRSGGARPERRGTPADFLVIGLGNPGREYERSRHNVGFEVIERLCFGASASLKVGKERALAAEISIAGQRVALACPTTFMNLSGESAVKLVRRYGIEDPSHIIIVHDELDLPPGVVKVKVGGGLAGHNGLRSITQHVKTQDYLRIRIGVGKPPSKEAGAGHVLNKVPKAERGLLDECVIRGAEAVELIVAAGVDAAMQQVNAAT